MGKGVCGGIVLAIVVGRIAVGIGGKVEQVAVVPTVGYRRLLLWWWK